MEVIKRTRKPYTTIVGRLLEIPEAAKENRRLLTAVGKALLTKIKEAFLVKSLGGTDEAGEQWEPLSPVTIVKRLAKRRTRAQRGRPARPSQALTKRQQARWWDVYRRALTRYNGNRGHAAAAAWLVLKEEGAVPLKARRGGERVDILVDTKLLIRSLSPNTSSEHQIFKVDRGSVVVGTNRKGAADHHKGKPSSNLPQRRLWPPVKQWPPSWWRGILDAARQGVVETTVSLIRGA